MYNSLIKSTEEVALATLPKNKGRGQAKSSSSQNVVEARNNLKSISIAYHKSPTQAKKIQLIMAKKTLDDAYLDSEVNFINGKINDLSRHHISEKHHLAWKTIKELSGKKTNSAIRIKGGSSKKRLENWSNHFKNLLGKGARLAEYYTLPSVTISEPLNIDTSPVTLSELKTSTKQLNLPKRLAQTTFQL